MRRRLGLDPALPAILLVGGGEGMGALEGTVTKLGEELGPTAQVGGFLLDECLDETAAWYKCKGCGSVLISIWDTTALRVL